MKESVHCAKAQLDPSDGQRDNHINSPIKTGQGENMLFFSDPNNRVSMKDGNLLKLPESTESKRFEDIASGEGHDMFGRGYPSRDSSILANPEDSVMNNHGKGLEAAEQRWRQLKPTAMRAAHLLRLIYYLWIVPAMIGHLILPKWISRTRLAIGPKFVNYIIGKYLSEAVRVMREEVVTPFALHVVYNVMRFAAMPGMGIKTIGHDFICQPYGLATMARAFMTKSALLAALHDLWVKQGVEKIYGASLAAGSAEVLIQVLDVFYEMHPSARGNIHWDLVDLNPQALSVARAMAKEWDVLESLTCYCMKLQKYIQDQKDSGRYKHVIEIVGYLDYQEDDKVAEYHNAIRSLLVMDGFMISAMIGDLGEDEKFILRWAVGWPLLRCRTKLQYIELLRAGRWRQNEIIVINTHAMGEVLDPNGGHTVVLCQKKETSGQIDLPKLLHTGSVRVQLP